MSTPSRGGAPPSRPQSASSARRPTSGKGSTEAARAAAAAARKERAAEAARLFCAQANENAGAGSSSAADAQRGAGESGIESEEEVGDDRKRPEQCAPAPAKKRARGYLSPHASPEGGPRKRSAPERHEPSSAACTRPVRRNIPPRREFLRTHGVRTSNGVGETVILRENSDLLACVTRVRI